MQAQDMSRWMALAAGLLLGAAGCATVPNRDVMARPGLIPIPEVALAETPAPVRATIESTAAGRRILRINRVRQLEGPLYRAYIASGKGPELMAVNHDGRLINHAVVVAFNDMPLPVREASKDAIAGEIGLCRRNLVGPGEVYFVDYLVMGEEPVFAVIEGNGRLLTIIGYGEDDGDEEE